MTALLQVKNLKVSFRKEKEYAETLRGITFDVRKGEMLGIVGESGCGKSVTSLSIMGLLPKGMSQIDPSSEIIYQDKQIAGISESEFRKIRGNEIAMIFQDPMTSLNPVFTVGFQIIEMIREHNKCSKKEAHLKGVEMLQKVGIPRAKQIMDEYPHQLSGGMRQRVMIAMAMACNPTLLIADEPTTALDVTIQAQILDLMKKLQTDFGTSILLITHDLGVVSEVCDRVIVMYAGMVIEEADVDELFDDPKHPYTLGLLQSIPDIEKDVTRLEAIPGMVPQAEEKIPGCRFAPRCKFAMDHCFVKVPPTEWITETHSTNCWLYSEETGEPNGRNLEGSTN
ncbi:ABC transporter ATP-binding protein [Planococcus sp. YIM B11945]|uniref:ABC transporter ATP-binding protein n=1 Tax=Planococcus sp. YIM B11945 TaxID=3435410 RepID=UPI003D7ED37C